MTADELAHLRPTGETWFLDSDGNVSGHGRHVAEVHGTLRDAALIEAAPELADMVRRLLAAARCGYDPAVTLREYGGQADALLRRVTYTTTDPGA